MSCSSCLEGWTCEKHIETPWPHDTCAGPGMPCRNKECWYYLAQRVVELQATLAEERGKVMEAEFYQEHLKPGIPDPIGCATCILGKGWDKRHSWSRQQWTEAARKGEG